jgi:hypothetical protein
MSMDFTCCLTGKASCKSLLHVSYSQTCKASCTSLTLRPVKPLARLLLSDLLSDSRGPGHLHRKETCVNGHADWVRCLALVVAFLVQKCKF